MNYIICHYHEIALKGGNRGFFERKLVENIKSFLPKDCFKKIKNISGRIIVELTEEGLKNKEEMKSVLKNIFGIANFSFAESCEQDIDSIKEKAYQVLKKEDFESFRISTKRANKNFKFKSQEVSEKVGAYIVEKLNKKVDLENFDENLFIEIVEDYVFVFTSKVEGGGGLPVGSSGKGLVLISGGIDSPVAALEAMKRGIKISLIHFHSFPYTSKESIKKVERIVGILSKFQFGLKLYLTPFGDIQKEILLNTPAKFRVLLYKRMMVRIAEKIAHQEKAKALITGESVGQVASQTLENIKVIEQAVDSLILRPLISRDKDEIVKIAKEIKTFEVSTLPYDDCCTRFVPKHPETKGSVRGVEKAEEDLDIKKLVQKAVKETKLKKIKFKK